MTLPPVAVASLLLAADRTLEALARGRSMTGTIPPGAVIRIRPTAPTTFARGMVVAVRAGALVVSHRVVARVPRRGPARYIVTRGDARTVCDLPVPAAAVLGEVVAWRGADRWEPVGPSPGRPGWRAPAAAVFDRAVGVVLAWHPGLAARLARAGRLVAQVWARHRRRDTEHG